MSISGTEVRLFVATKAFIAHQGKVLILKESIRYGDAANVGRFDVPGGRIKPGQKFDDSLRREILEETGLTITIGKPFFVNEWRPVVNNEQWQVVGTFFECQAESDQIKLSEDHDAFAWIDPQKYQDYNLIPNLIPAFEAYLKLKSAKL